MLLFLFKVVLLVSLNSVCVAGFDVRGGASRVRRLSFSLGPKWVLRPLTSLEGGFRTAPAAQMGQSNGLRRLPTGVSRVAIAVMPAASIALGSALKVFCRQWVRVNGWAKLNGPRGWLYWTIPIVSGLVNLATNKLAVGMIFYPLEFFGLPLLPRPEGQPLGFIGWQGIVPTKVRTMGSRITETLLGLIDLKSVLKRLSSETLADGILPLLFPVADTKLRALLPTAGVPPIVYEMAALNTGLLKSRLRACLVRVILQLQAQPNDFIDLKSAIVGDLMADKRIIVDLFKTCGREELKFVVSSGLLGGILLGIVQMLAWIVFPRPWTLAAGGALSGYLTDFFALKILFEPVDPVIFRYGKFHYRLQGLFLQRQQEVSAEFAHYVCVHLLTPAKLWQVLATGSRSSAVATLIKAELKAELSLVLSNLREEQWDRVAGELLQEIPRCAKPTEGYMLKSLRLQETIRDNMLTMSPAEFESVLHPIFSEDEATLIAVGSVLGAVAGFAQVPFY